MKVPDLDYLFEFAEYINAQINYTDLSSTHSKLLGYAKPPFIYLDITLKHKPRKHKCVLAEEIGHILYPPRPGHIAFHSTGYLHTNHFYRSNIKTVVAQDERLALDWATNILIPDVDFWRAITKGVNSIYELTEYFDVEEWFIYHKLSYIQRKTSFQGY